jgi:RNA polymerase sigma factor (sigma-70 family)
MPNTHRTDDPPDPGELWRLLDLARDGSAAAYDEFYRRTVGEIRDYLVSRTRSPDLADDLTATVYTNVLGVLATITASRASPINYLMRVAANLATSHYRRPDTVLSVPIADIGDALAAAHAAHPERPDQSCRAATAPGPAPEVAMVLWAGVERLPESQQAVLRLRYEYGCTTRDTANILGRTEPDVRQLKARAIRALAKDEDVRSLA